MATPLSQGSSRPVSDDDTLRTIFSILKCEAFPVALRVQAWTRGISYVKGANEVAQMNYIFGQDPMKCSVFQCTLFRNYRPANSNSTGALCYRRFRHPGLDF